MHELSIALGILEVAGEEAERHGGGRVAAIHLKLGPLSGVVKEALLSAYELAREGSPFALTDLLVQDVPIVVHCPACAADRPVVSIQEMCCALCGTPAPEVVSGRELEITALELEQGA
jgi:hydrogenase nickel incorporation protein HypA/HybF